MTAQFEIEFCSKPASNPDWDKVVDQSLQPDPMMLAGWHGILSDVFNVEPIYACAHDSEKTVAVMATYGTKSFFTGKVLRGMDGTIATLPGVEISQNMLLWAMEQGRKRNLNFCQFRCSVEQNLLGRCEQKLYTCVDLSPGIKRIWDGITSNVRRKIRKAEKSGYVTKASQEIREEFADIFLRRQRDLGTPAPSRRLFSAINKHLENRIAFIGIYKENSLVGGALLLRAGRNWLNPYIAVNQECQKHYASYLLYWKMIQHSVENNGQMLDLGRSQANSGTHRFKMQWTSNDVERPYSYVLLNGRLPNKSLDQSAGYKHEIWKRLPIAISEPVGVVLRRSVPFS